MRREASSKFHSNIVNQRFTYDPGEKPKPVRPRGYFDREVNRPVQEKKDAGGYTTQSVIRTTTSAWADATS